MKQHLEQDLASSLKKSTPARLPDNSRSKKRHGHGDNSSSMTRCKAPPARAPKRHRQKSLAGPLPGVPSK
jgi:hypothetical protein